MKNHEWDLAIQDLTKAISLEIGGQAWLMGVKSFRKFYPEYNSASDEAIAHKLQETFFSDAEISGFPQKLSQE